MIVGHMHYQCQLSSNQIFILFIGGGGARKKEACLVGLVTGHSNNNHHQKNLKGTTLDSTSKYLASDDDNLSIL